MEVQVATDASAATQSFALRLAGAALRASALTPIAGGDTPEIHVRTKLEARNDVRPRTADYEMKPMLGDETEAGIPGVSFAAQVSSPKDGGHWLVI